MWPILVHINSPHFILAVYSAAPSAANVRFLKNCGATGAIYKGALRL